MKIKKLHCVNYRSLRNFQWILPDETNGNQGPYVMIGPNDSGKSSILSAIALLLSPDRSANLSGRTSSDEGSDLSNQRISDHEAFEFLGPEGASAPTQSERVMCILGEFSLDEEDEKRIDKGGTALLRFVTGGCNSVTIIRVFDVGVGDSQYYYLGTDAEGDLGNIWDTSEEDVDKLMGKYEVPKGGIKNVNRKGRPKITEKAIAIRDRFTDKFKPCWIQMGDGGKSDFKLFPKVIEVGWKIDFGQIQSVANVIIKKNLDDFQSGIQDHIRNAVDVMNAAIRRDTDEFVQQVKREVSRITDVKIEVSASSTPKISNIFVTKTGVAGHVNIESQGEGVKRSILYAMIKGDSLKKKDSGNENFIWCFDEPETHMYPAAQRSLYGDISKLVGQCFISTHSSIFTDRANLSNVFTIDLDQSGYSLLGKCSGITSIHDSLGIRNSDILFFNKFVCVEGATEFHLLRHAIRVVTGKLPLELGIQIINLGGCDKAKMSLELFDQYLLDYRKDACDVKVLLDGDTTIVHDNITKIGLYDLEDSIDDNVWRELVETFISVRLEASDFFEIRNGLGTDSAKKFYKRLRSVLWVKLHALNSETAHGELAKLPDKGEELALALSDIMTKPNQMPEKLVQFICELQT